MFAGCRGVGVFTARQRVTSALLRYLLLQPLLLLPPTQDWRELAFGLRLNVSRIRRATLVGVVCR